MEKVDGGRHGQGKHGHLKDDRSGMWGKKERKGVQRERAEREKSEEGRGKREEERREE